MKFQMFPERTNIIDYTIKVYHYFAEKIILFNKYSFSFLSFKISEFLKMLRISSLIQADYAHCKRSEVMNEIF